MKGNSILHSMVTMASFYSLDAIDDWHRRAGRLCRSAETHKPNGAKGCSRRVKQMEAGTCTSNYVHGAQYDSRKR